MIVTLLTYILLGLSLAIPAGATQKCLLEKSATQICYLKHCSFFIITTQICYFKKYCYSRKIL